MKFGWRKLSFYCLAISWVSTAIASAQDIDAEYSAPGPIEPGQKPNHKITFAATSIPGVFDEHFPGPYNVMFFRATKKYPGAIDMEMYPIRRAVKMMQNRMVDCLFVANDNREFHRDLGFPIDELVFSQPFRTNVLHVYSNKGDQLAHSASDLEGKRVAVSSGTYQGYWFQNNMPETAANVEVSGLDRAFDLLEARRVDHVISFSFDAEVYLNQSDRREQFAFDDSYVLAESNEGIVCWRNEKTLAFIDVVDHGLGAIR